MVALIAVYEGTPEVGPVPLFRTANREAVQIAVRSALADAERAASAFTDDECLAAVSRDQLETLRAALAMVTPIEPTGAES